MPLHANSRKVIIMNAVEITIIVVAAVLLLCGILFGVVSYLVFYEVIARNSKIPGKMDANAKKKMMETNPEKFLLDPREEWLNDQTFENYSITNVDGNKLKGYLLKADKPSDVYVFGSHGYRCWGKREFRLMAKFYHDLGFNVFIVDHQAHGESEGKYIGFGSHESRDAMQWLKFMTDTFGSDIQIILHGVSMGCATVMMMSGNPDLPKNVKFTVADCGYTSPWAEFDYQLKNAHVPTSPLLDGGLSSNLGVDDNAVGLPFATSKFEKFTEGDYVKLVNSMKSGGTLEVKNDFSAFLAGGETFENVAVSFVK